VKDNQLFSNLADAMVAMAPQLGLSQPIPSSKKKTRKKEKKEPVVFSTICFYCRARSLGPRGDRSQGCCYPI
jgi:hypothetical protein